MRILLSFLIILTLVSCSQKKIVEEHFREHGFTFPVDSSGLGSLNMEYVGIQDDELRAAGVREYITEAVIFVKEYFQQRKIRNSLPGTYGIVLERPVLYRDDSDRVGIMVRVTAYGAGNTTGDTKGVVRVIDEESRLWSTENFAYFVRNKLYQWEYGGMVYQMTFQEPP